jgi:enediyne biosynthesis thioesterase
MFLHDHAPDVLEELRKGLYMVTVRVSCEYFNELFALDTVIIRMTIGDITQSRITMLFDYFRDEPQGEVLIARGEQQVACMRKGDSEGLVPTKIPPSLQAALNLYMESK